uniref:Odorant binding protein 4 n=1 Tax=Colaphellus bowringi TaxID=561076 RepID=A0A0S3J2H2_9CUCU|nr:odorant binding protein 4 [Colaphellus bowringi]
MKHREEIGLECLRQVNIQRDTIENAKATLNFPEDRKYKDFLACSYKKQGFQSQDGVILYNSIKDFLSRYYKRNDLKVMDNCKENIREDHGEMALNALRCIMDNLKNMEEKSRR